MGGGDHDETSPLLVGTKKGAFVLESDEARRDWSTSAPLCEGWPIHDLIVEPGSGAILAAAGTRGTGPPCGAPRTVGRPGRIRRPA